MSETRRLFSAVDAARYLGVSRAHFWQHIRPTLGGVVNVAAPSSRKPTLRWTVEDLDAWVALHRQERKSA